MIAVVLFATRAEAVWQTGQITVGGNLGGTASYNVEKQSLTAAGYNYVMPFGLAQMNNGQIIMTASLETNTTASYVVTYSSDDGNTWSPFQVIPNLPSRPTMLTYLGGGNLSLYGTGYYSSDYGHTWTIQGTVDQNFVANEGNAAVDRKASGDAARVSEIGYNLSNGYPSSVPTSMFRYSLNGGATWQGQVTPSAWTFQDTYNGQTYTWGTNEGSLVRAANGWLVAALRTDPPSRFTETGQGGDELNGTAISISKDNGKTWSPLDRLFDAGRMHANLQLLPNGNLLMTMIERENMQFGGGLINGEEGENALISTDNGLTWHTNNLIKIDTFNYNDPNAPFDAPMSGHIATTVLSDGTVLTAYANYLSSSAVLTKFDPTAIALSPLLGDMNFDGHVDASDIARSETALVDPTAFVAAKSGVRLNDQQLGHVCGCKSATGIFPVPIFRRYRLSEIG